MSTVHRLTRTYPKTPFFLQVRPLDAPDGKPWAISLESELLTLIRPDNTTVLKVHREEAARYIRFAFDLLRGRTVSFVIVEGLKSYRFSCPRDQLLKLLAWLPHLSSVQIRRQIRQSAVVAALAGVLHLVLPQSLFWVWGVLLLTAGVAGIALPRRAMAPTFGVVMLFAGLWDLMLGTPTELRPWAVTPEARVIPIVVGTVILLWGIQQIALLAPNHRLRLARALRDQRVAFLPEKSRLVRRVGAWCIAAALLFGAYATTVLTISVLRGGMVQRDAIVFGILAALAAFSAAVCFLRKRPAYLEAKVSAQMLAAVVVFSLWSLVVKLDFRAPFAAFGGLSSGDLAEVFGRVYGWVALLVCVLALNRWFARAMDRELEEQRG